MDKLSQIGANEGPNTVAENPDANNVVTALEARINGILSRGHESNSYITLNADGLGEDELASLGGLSEYQINIMIYCIIQSVTNLNAILNLKTLIKVVNGLISSK